MQWKRRGWRLGSKVGKGLSIIPQDRREDLIAMQTAVGEDFERHVSAVSYGDGLVIMAGSGWDGIRNP